MTALVAALVCAWGLHRLLLPRPRPRRVPERIARRARRPGPRAAPTGAVAARVGSGPGSARRRRPPSRSGDASGDLESCCDLLAVAASAGCSLHQAVAAVGAGGGGPVADALRVAAEDAARGVPLVAAVERMADRAAAGPELRPLVSTLVVAAGSGTPVGPALQRLADAERRRRRRAVEARIRRLPVLLLLPLVLCVLPAFVLMTLVPVGLAAARGTADAVPGALARHAAPGPHLLPLEPARAVGPVPGAHP